MAMTHATGLDGRSPRLEFLLRAADALVAGDAAARALFQRALSVPGAPQWPFDYARIELLFGEYSPGP